MCPQGKCNSYAWVTQWAIDRKCFLCLCPNSESWPPKTVHKPSVLPSHLICNLIIISNCQPHITSSMMPWLGKFLQMCCLGMSRSLLFRGGAVFPPQHHLLASVPTVEETMIWRNWLEVKMLPLDSCLQWFLSPEQLLLILSTAVSLPGAAESEVQMLPWSHCMWLYNPLCNDLSLLQLLFSFVNRCGGHGGNCCKFLWGNCSRSMTQLFLKNDRGKSSQNIFCNKIEKGMHKRQQ